MKFLRKKNTFLEKKGALKLTPAYLWLNIFEFSRL